MMVAVRVFHGGCPHDYTQDKDPATGYHNADMLWGEDQTVFSHDDQESMKCYQNDGGKVTEATDDG